MIFDIETDGLDPTFIHVMSWEDDKDIHSTSDYDEMRAVLMSAKELSGHNIIRYDLPALSKILGFNVAKHQRVVDTLPLSWYVNYDRSKHGLEGYGNDYGVPKPKIDDWENLTYEDYAHRCEEDVKINTRLYKELMYKLKKLYKDQESLDKCINYLTFKMYCAAEQEKLGWRIDYDKAKGHLDELTALKEEKITELTKAMPKRVIHAQRLRPKNWTKKDGSLSALAEKWVELTESMYLPSSTKQLMVEVRREEPNPNSITQVKSWLYDIGWQPTTYEYHKNKETGEERSIEQIRKDGELCESVKQLSYRNPEVELLEGLTIINHRLGIFKSFVDSTRDGVVRASIAGFTNTLRFRHARPLVNLPSVDKPYGKEIRGCLVAPEGYSLCGADMVSLEDTTKRHYMKDHDPKYVEQMSQDGFDPHLDLARHAGKVTQEDIDKHNSGEVSLKALRKKYKVVNYSATYGVGANKLARTMGIQLAEASTMLDAFWDRNWSIQTVADNCKVREVNGGTWLLNPVSGIYHSLRYDKDRFSTLNQSTGVYCFDTWVAGCAARGMKIIGQFHDEIIALVKEGEEHVIEDTMNTSIQKTNERVDLNVELGIDYSFGKNYAEIH
tara:strand:+ start:3414 stop:5249 length:1836 start_codon:yes stop_codon:yes gene_type:complete